MTYGKVYDTWVSGVNVWKVIQKLKICRKMNEKDVLRKKWRLNNERRKTLKYINFKVVNIKSNF